MVGPVRPVILLPVYDRTPLAPHDLWSAWSSDPVMLATLAALALLYWLGRRHRRHPASRGGDRRPIAFWLGWGALVLHAAEAYGVHATGITLSQNQFDHVKAAIAARGLEGRVEVRLQDYLELPEDSLFDKVASVGMFEHVGVARFPEPVARSAVATERALVAVPLIGDRDRVVGALCVFDVKPLNITAPELDALKALGRDYGFVLESQLSEPVTIAPDHRDHDAGSPAAAPPSTPRSSPSSWSAAAPTPSTASPRASSRSSS